jgi:hypothetical protein
MTLQLSGDTFGFARGLIDPIRQADGRKPRSLLTHLTRKARRRVANGTFYEAILFLSLTAAIRALCREVKVNLAYRPVPAAPSAAC